MTKSSHYIFLIFLLALVFSPLFAEEIAVKIRFTELETFRASGKKIEIRGFLSETKDGMYILSNEPNLKTCCAGAKGKREKQILITGNFTAPKTQNAITIQGFLDLNEPTDVAPSMPMYRLENAVVILEASDHTSLVFGSLLGALCIILLCVRFNTHP